MSRESNTSTGSHRERGARRLSRSEELELALEVARAHYLEDQSKVAIAERFDITRFQAARLLTLAHEQGMVHIEVRPPTGVDTDLSRRLKVELGIANAIVVSPLAGSSVVEHLGSTLARTLGDMVRPGGTVGLTWSRATIAMAQQITHLEPCSLVQLGGHVEGASDLPGTAATLPGNVELVQAVAQASGGRSYPIYAPLVVQDRHTAQALRRQPTIAAAVELFDRLDLAVISVGAWRSAGSTIHETMPATIVTRASELGVVGEISGRLYDAEGRDVPDVIGDRVVGIDLEQLRRTPRVIATSFGAYRAEATRAAARAGVIGTLIADRSLAEALCQA